jgi:hypothetical protein
MAKKTSDTKGRLKTVETRPQHLELLPMRSNADFVKLREMRETPVQPWKHLVRRHHSWRKQLYLKGRNLTALQLVGSMRANDFDVTAATANYHLSAKAVREAVAYVKANKELLETEAEIERLLLKRDQGGIARGPQSVPG